MATATTSSEQNITRDQTKKIMDIRKCTYLIIEQVGDGSNKIKAFARVVGLSNNELRESVEDAIVMFAKNAREIEYMGVKREFREFEVLDSVAKQFDVPDKRVSELVTWVADGMSIDPEAGPKIRKLKAYASHILLRTK